MTPGKRVSTEMIAEVLRLRAQGLTYYVIAARTRLHYDTVGIILRKEKLKCLQEK